MAKQEAETPLMKQYNQIKGKYPDAVLLFRVGDFYETFGEDALKTSAALGIVLTKRANGKASEIHLAGFPHHALDTYLPKLVRAGYRVAICDQLEDPKLTKTIVKRGVTEMVTPGVAVNDNILDNRSNNFLCSLYKEGDRYGLALLDISTAEFLVAEGNRNYTEKLLQSFAPSELLYPKSKQRDFAQDFGEPCYTFKLDDWAYNYEQAVESLLKLFGTHSLKGFGIEDEKLCIVAAGAILHYLKDTEHNNLQHLTRIQKLQEEKFVWLDRFSIRNLELIFTNNNGATSLLDVLDKTTSPMGARLLRKWLVMPLLNVSDIEARLDAVEFFVKEKKTSTALHTALKSVGDLERLMAKVSLEKVSPREMVQLKRSLLLLPEMKQQLKASTVPALQLLLQKMQEQPELAQRIEDSLNDEAGPLVAKGNFIRTGCHVELDELRNIRSNARDVIAKIQQDEMVRTGISSLKVGFNNVFGYYLEVTHTHKHKVPADWIRKQTLTNAERYITEELKQLEDKILGAEEKIQQLEEQLFAELLRFAKTYTPQVQQTAQALARIDCLLSFANVSDQYHYTRPAVNNSFAINIQDGRHPVIERQLSSSDPFVPNDVFLDNETQQLLMITGPNMSGKSALLRQTALIVLMAQAGCFVPAAKAEIGLVDKIFTRVGASDNLSSGESTFMVEMNETASIVNNLSARSLVLLDEIGRGTATYDGISIAWSLAEYIHQHPSARARTLFATHYHELNELAEKFPRIKNFHVSTRETNNKVIFLRKLEAGGSEHSFGIHVARMAGMPKSLVDRADEILHELEANRSSLDTREKVKQLPSSNYQLSIFDNTDPKLKELLQELEKTDINVLSPVEALMKLNEWKRKLS